MSLKIHQAAITRQPESETSRIAVCVKPMHSRIFNSASARLIEHIELYKILGARKSFYYVQSASDHAMKILKHYQSQDQAEIVDWRGLERVDVRTHGLMAALNDCIMRYVFCIQYFC